MWNACEVLGLPASGPGSRCAGYAPSKGRKCLNPIAAANVDLACRILDLISRIDPQSERVLGLLSELAAATLCKRNHQNQNQDLVRAWTTKIVQFLGTGSVRRSPEVPTEPLQPQQRLPQSSDVLRIRAEIEIVRERTRPVQQAAPVELGAQLQYPQPASRSVPVLLPPIRSPTASPTPVAAEPAHNVTGAQTPPTPPRTPSPSAIASSITPPQETSASLIPATADLPENSSPLTSLPNPRVLGVTQRIACHEHHAIRRQLPMECPICTEPMLQGEALVWCKAQCGNNFHQACWQEWASYSRNRLRCVTCRTRWQQACEHDSASPRVEYDYENVWTTESESYDLDALFKEDERAIVWMIDADAADHLRAFWESMPRELRDRLMWRPEVSSELEDRG